MRGKGGTYLERIGVFAIYCSAAMSSKFLCALSVALILVLFCGASQGASYKYIRIGKKDDAQTKPVAGIAMMGGGDDLDEAFRWLCGKANSGDFLILRAHGDDDYNSYVNGLCKLNSVATLIIADRRCGTRSRRCRNYPARGSRLYCRWRSGELHSLLARNAGTGCDQPAHRRWETNRGHQRRVSCAGRVRLWRLERSG